MKTRSTITRLITITMAVAATAAAGLLFGAGWLQPVEAQSGDGNVRFVSYASAGIVYGEALRLNVGNTRESGGSLSLSFSYYIAHSSNTTSGAPLYESGMIQVPPGGFGSSKVSRRDLNTEGEPWTSRVQTLVKIVLEAPAGSEPADFPIWLEVIKEETGATSASGLWEHEWGHVLDVGPEQRLSYSVFYPNEAGSRPVRVQAYIYDSYGNILMRTDPVELRPDQSHTFNLNRDDLPLAGDPNTRHVQVRAAIRVVSMDGSERPVKLAVSLERVDNRTGSTTGGDYFTGTVSVSGDG